MARSPATLSVPEVQISILADALVAQIDESMDTFDPLTSEGRYPLDLTIGTHISVLEVTLARYQREGWGGELEDVEAGGQRLVLLDPQWEQRAEDFQKILDELEGGG